MKFIAASLALLGVFVALVGSQRLPAAPLDEDMRGRAYVEQTCVGCHAGPQLEVVVSGRLDPARRASFDAFLANHHVAEPALRADVIAYLEARFPPASQEP